MKYILFFIIFVSSYVQADTVGVADKMWTMVPSEVYEGTEELAENTVKVSQNYNTNVVVEDSVYQEVQTEIKGAATYVQTPSETSTIVEDTYLPTDTEVGEVIVIPTPTAFSSMDNVSMSVKQNLVMTKQIKVLKEYFSPLLKFINENISLFILIVLSSWILFYIVFYRPLARKVREYDVYDLNYDKNLRKSLVW